MTRSDSLGPASVAAGRGLSSVSGMILAGGCSSRMGADKALLREATTGETYLDHLVAELAGCDELLLSVDTAQRFPGCALPKVVDAIPGQGPLGGLCAGMSACRNHLLFVVACDQPLFRRELAERLVVEWQPGVDAVVPQEESGRRHSLCAVYAKSALPELRARLAAGNLRLRDALDALRVRYVRPTPAELAMLANVNTPNDVRALRA